MTVGAPILLLKVANTLLPLIGLWWVLAPHRGSRTEWFAKVLFVASYLFAVAFASVWLVPSVYAPYVYAIAFVLVLPLSWLGARKRPVPLPTPAARTRFAVYLLLAAVCVGVGAYGWLGRAAPQADKVELDFPLRDGRFYVASGGVNALFNDHFGDARAEPGGALAIDVIAVDRLGQRSAGLRPDDPEAYTIFGWPVYAPCSGMVTRTVDGLPDRSDVPVTDDAAAGNQIHLECGEAQVVLSHLRQGSFEVRAGDVVKRGARIAAVGSSGRTAEPHLHMHAQAADGAPLAMTFGGRTLSRGLVAARR
jgi:Peptidase family M23